MIGNPDRRLNARDSRNRIFEEIAIVLGFVFAWSIVAWAIVRLMP